MEYIQHLNCALSIEDITKIGQINFKDYNGVRVDVFETTEGFRWTVSGSKNEIDNFRKGILDNFGVTLNFTGFNL